MILEVTDVRHVRDHVLWLRFKDGAEGTVDLADELTGPVFGPLADKRVFKTVCVDPLLRTIAWPNGADLAPEFLYGRLKPARKGSPVYKRSQTALHALRTAVREAAAERVFKRQPAMAREKQASYKSKTGRKP